MRLLTTARRMLLFAPAVPAPNPRFGEPHGKAARIAHPGYPTPMSNAVRELISILDLEALEINLFRGRSPQVGWQRVFGGQVIGQALVAACRTVDGRKPH